jgi:glutamate racemase
MIFNDMNTRPVLFLDSGIGSLPYGVFFHNANRDETLICVADRAHFPYGPKQRETLIELLFVLTEKLIDRYNPKILALACNTASVSALEALRERFPHLPIVGTVPAVKPAVQASVKRRVGVLGTERTIEDPCIAELAARYGPDCEIIGIAAPSLVEFAERRFALADPAERFLAVEPWVEKFREAGADALVLGCTHFLLLLEEFKTAAGGTMGVYDSLEGVSRRVESFLDAEGGRLRSRGGNRTPVLAVSGDAPLEPYWALLAAFSGFSLGRI